MIHGTQRGAIDLMQMDPKYQHSSIHLFILVSKSHLGSTRSMVGFNQETNAEKSNYETEENGKQGSASEALVNTDAPRDEIVGCGELDDWEARRVGSLAARLLKDVNLH